MSRLLRLTSLVLFPLLVGAGAALAQDAPDAAAKGAELLKAAIQYQGPEEFASEGAIHDLTVRIQVEVKEPDPVSMGVNRYLTMDPVHFRSEWKTTTGTDVYGFDGKHYWFAEYDPDAQLVEGRLLIGDKWKKDCERIQNEIAETKYLFRFFFLANLRGPKVVLEVDPDETIDHFGEKVKCHVLTRTNPGSTEPPVKIWLDAKTNALLRGQAVATEKGQRTLTFCFRYNEGIQPRVKGVLFPYRIETREQAFGAKEERVTSISTVKENGIAFNTGFEPTVFVCPKKEKEGK